MSNYMNPLIRDEELAKWGAIRIYGPPEEVVPDIRELWRRARGHEDDC